MNKKTIKAILLVIAIAAAGYGVALTQGRRDPLPGDVGKPMHVSMAAYERVTGTGILRCGYYDAPPYLKFDPTTRKTSGIVSEYIAELEKLLGVRFQFVLSAPARHATDLKDSMADAQCLATLQGKAQIEAADMGRPLFFVPQYIYAAAKGKMRTGQDLNVSTVRFALADGSTARLKKQNFKSAADVPVGIEQDIAELYAAVADGRADVVITDPASVKQYNAAHPEKALRIVSSKPISMQPYFIATPKGDPALRQMIDDALLVIQSQNKVARFIEQIDSGEQMIFAPTRPFVSPSAR